MDKRGKTKWGWFGWLLVVVVLFCTKSLDCAAEENVPPLVYDDTAACYTDQNLYYRILDADEKTVQVGKGNLDLYGAKATGLADQNATTIDIPAQVSIDGVIYRVTKVSCFAFYKCENIRSLTLGENLEELELGAFKGCTRIHNIQWDACKVKDIKSNGEDDTVFGYGNVFSGVGDKTNGIILSFGDKVTRIPARAFYTGSSVGQYCGNISTIHFGANIETIGEYAFACSERLDSLDSLPEKVTGIPAHCFEKCTGIRWLEISDNIISIGESAFSGCSGIESLSFGKNLKQVGNNAFAGCINVNELRWNVPNMSDFTSGNGIFKKLGSEHGLAVTFGSDVVRIPANLFYADTYSVSEQTAHISEIHFENTGDESVTIGENAFRNCGELENIEIGKNVTEIGNNAFNGCRNVKTVKWNAELVKDFETNNGIFESLGIDVEAGATLEIGADVKKIPDYAFYGSSFGARNVNLAKIICAEGLKDLKIGESAFQACGSLTDYDFGDRAVEIGASAFAKCTGLSTLDFNGSVKVIGEAAFSGCSGVTTIVLDDAVQEIGENAFDGIGSMKAVGAVLYNDTKLSLQKGREYNGSYLEIYVNYTELVENHGVHKWYAGNEELQYVNERNRTYVKGGVQATLEVNPNHTVKDAWVVDDVKLNGDSLEGIKVNTDGGKIRYVVTFPYCASNIEIKYKERPWTYLAAIEDQGFDSLQEAVYAAAAGDTITLCSNQTITSPVIVDRSVTIKVDDTMEQVVLSNAVTTDSMLKIAEGVSLSMEGSQIWKGNTVTELVTDKPMILVNGELVIGKGVVLEGQAGNSTKGGAICNNGSVTLNGGVIRNNQATYGAGIYCGTDAKLRLESGQIKGNTAVYGAGVYAQSEVTLVGAEEENLQITDNMKKDSDSQTNLYLKKGTLQLTGEPLVSDRIGIVYTNNTVVVPMYLTNKPVSDKWLKVLVSDDERYTVGVDVQGLYIGYTVTFDLGYEENGQSVPTIKGAALPDGRIKDYPDVDRDGYILDGWYNGVTKYSDEKKTTGPVTLTAKWTEIVAKIGDDVYSTLGEAVEAAGNDTVIQLVRDVTLPAKVTLNKNITIDGNGHTLTRKTISIMFEVNSGKVVFRNVIMEGETKGASLLYVNGGTVSLGTGVLLKNDSASIGTSNGLGAVYVIGTGVVKLEGGVIQGNNSTNNGAGVYVDGGTFESISGEITENTASTSGGGIYVKTGTVRLSGGRISGNTVRNGYGGALYVNAGAVLSVSGTPVVTGNLKGTEENNVYLTAEGQKLQVEDKLGQGAMLGISLVKSSLPTITKDEDGIITGHNDVALTQDVGEKIPEGILYSDSIDYITVKADGEWKLRKNSFSVVFDANGGTIKLGSKKMSRYITEVRYGTTLQNAFDELAKAVIQKEEEPNNFAYWYDTLKGNRVALEDEVKETRMLSAKWVNESCKVSDFDLEERELPYIGAQKLILTPGTEGCEVHYTLDGTEPTFRSALYKEPIPLTDDVTVRAICTGTEYMDSEIVQKSYKIRIVNSVALKDITDVLYKGDSESLVAEVEVGNSNTGKGVKWYLADRELVTGEGGIGNNAGEIQKIAVEGVTIDENGTLKAELNTEATSVIVCAESEEDSSKKATKKIILKNPVRVYYNLGYETQETLEDSTYYKAGQTAVLKGAERNGYTFEGWKLGDNDKLYPEGDSLTMADNDVQLTAVWTENIVKSITLTVDGEPVPAEGLTLTKGDKLVFGADVEIQGKISNKVTWSIKGAEAAGTTISAEGELSVALLEPVSSIKVVATSQYDATKHAETTVTLMDRIWNVSGYVDQNAETPLWNQGVGESKKIALPSCEAVKEGYTFAGWSLKDDASHMIYLPTEEVVITGRDYVFYAVWEKNEVTGIQFIKVEKELKPGDAGIFCVEVEGTGTYSEEVIWTLSGNQSETTAITADGIKCELTVGSDEKAGELTLTVVSKEKSEVKVEYKIKVSGVNSGNDPEEQDATTQAPQESTTQTSQETTTAPQEGTTQAPQETTTAPQEGTTQAPQETTTAPQDATTRAPQETTTVPQEGTTQAPQESTTAPQEGTTQAPQETTTVPQEGTTQAPQETTTVPQEGTTQASEEATTQVPEEATTQTSEDATTQASEDATTQAHEETTTEEEQATTAEEDETTQAPQAATTQSPKPQATTAKPAQQATTTEKKTQPATQAPGSQQATTEAAKTEKTVKAGDAFTLNSMKYKVTSVEKKTVAFTAPVSKKKTKITIPATVKYEGISWKVTSMAKNCLKKNTKLKKVTIGKNVEKIGANALNGDTNCNSIVIKSSKLKSVGKNALKGIHKNAVIKVPKKKLTDYKKLLKKKGQKTTVKIKA